MQHTKPITTLLRKVFVSLLLTSVITMTACSRTKKAQTQDISFEEIPEFVFAYSYSPEYPDAPGGYSNFVVKTIPQEAVIEHYKRYISVIDKNGSNLLDYPEAVPDVEAPSYNWIGFYYDQDGLRFAELHKNMCMTDISSKDDTVNGLYEWMKTII